MTPSHKAKDGSNRGIQYKREQRSIKNTCPYNHEEEIETLREKISDLEQELLMCDREANRVIKDLETENKELLHSSDRRRIKNLIESIDKLEAKNKELQDKMIKRERTYEINLECAREASSEQAKLQERERILKWFKDNEVELINGSISFEEFKSQIQSSSSTQARGELRREIIKLNEVDEK